MKWVTLNSGRDVSLGRGSILMSPRCCPHKDALVMIICEAPNERNYFAVMALTGENAGVNCFASMPHHVFNDGALLAGKIHDNWHSWFDLQGNSKEISFACHVCPDGIGTGLYAEDIKQSTKGWLRLSKNKATTLPRGALIRFTASYPFESEVVMMVCDAPHDSKRLGLITISGYKAGINCYVAFPDEFHVLENHELRSDLLYENWQNWVWPEGSPDNAWILPKGLSADDLK